MKLLTRKANIEIREMLFNAMINQIRYPNLITLYFINLILLFFAEKGKAAMQEQIARFILSLKFFILRFFFIQKLIQIFLIYSFFIIIIIITQKSEKF